MNLILQMLAPMLGGMLLNHGARRVMGPKYPSGVGGSMLDMMMYMVPSIGMGLWEQRKAEKQAQQMQGMGGGVPDPMQFMMGG